MLVGSLSLAIGLVIFDITLRELDLSSTTTQSQYAIYAADAGAECVLYWDSKYGPLSSGSAFATSTASAPPSSDIDCLGHDIAADGTPLATFGLPVTGWNPWNTSVRTASAATTTFTLMLGPTTASACATVDVGKNTVSGITYTNITSRGFNTCNPNTPLRVERRFQVRY